MNTKTKYACLLSLLYFIVSLIGVFHHELWLDESHHWLLARDSVSFADLIRNTRYEGHPILWNTLLYVITRITLNPIWMQLLHILISTTAVLVFLRKAPFSWLFKCLFIFGYFMIFEYNLISRNYMLGVLFLFLACSVFQKRSKKFMLLSVYLAIAANTHLIFAVVAMALFATSMFEFIQKKQLFRRPSYLLGCVIFIVGIALAAIQIMPPHDTQFFNHVHEVAWQERFSKGFISLFKGLVTIPDFTSMHFWNSNIFVNCSKPVTALFGLLAYIIPIILFRSRWTIFFVYLGLIGVQLFFLITQMSATRYDGITFMIITVGLWIDKFQPRKQKDSHFFSILLLLKNPFIYSILALQVFSGIYAYYMDYRYPFTTAKETATYLIDNRLNDREIISVTCDGTLISPYVKKKIWFLCSENYQSYCHWDLKCVMGISKNVIVEKIIQHMKTRDAAVYVSNYPILDTQKAMDWVKIDKQLQVRFLKKFDSSIVRNTTMYIYEMETIHSNLP